MKRSRRRYQEMITALKDAESRMDPVLRKLHDYVLVLKHSLNAQAIAALSGESVKIQTEINRLLADMGASINQADEFIRQMPK
jgi:division protein CdvB (Snf7/Vps24/ESCRT-III family)